MALVFHRTRSTNTSHCTLDTLDAGIAADLEPARETKMQILRLILVASGLALLLPAASLADPAEGFNDMSPEQRREYVQGLSEEERQALREQKRAEWESMSEEERQALRRRQEENRANNRAAMRENWEDMSEEERAAARQKNKEREAQRREIWNNMSDEEKAAARQHMREQRDMQKGKHKDGGEGRGNGRAARQRP